MRIAISGSNGLIGSAVVDYLRAQHHDITFLVRPETKYKPGETIVRWDVAKDFIEADKLENHDAVIHLAGANIADKPWSDEYKKIILDSRVKGTTLLSQSLALLRRPPKVLLSASAIGYYGPHPAVLDIDESAPRGKTFLSQVCAQWEKSTQAAEAARTRVVHMRLGFVLSYQGGGLAKMLPPFEVGLGGRLGSGRQMTSWIALQEIPLIMNHLIRTESISGAVNVVAPNPVSNADFTRALGKVLQRPTIFPVPGFIVNMMFGEMGQELLLQGAKVLPQKLLNSGYTFTYPDIESGLKAALTR